MSLDGQHRVSVLRDLMFGDIHAAHDLETGNNGVLQIRRYGQHLVQQSVDAHAYCHFVLLRLQMNIAGLFDKGALDDGVDEADRRRCIGVGIRALSQLCRNDVAIAFSHLTLHILDCSGCPLAAVQLFNDLLGRLFGRNHRHDFFARDRLDLFLRDEIQRIAHRDIERISDQLDRNDAVLLRDIARHKPRQLHRNRNRTQVYKINPQLHLQCIDEFFVCDHLAFQQNITQSAFAFFLYGECLF